MKKRPILCSYILAALLGLVCGSAAVHADERPDSKALFTASRYIEHVKFLAGDELAGRYPGTEGIERAAEYIAAQLKAAGCQPAGEDGTFFQTFEVRAIKRLLEDQAAFEVEGLDADWKIREDWIPLPFSKPGAVEGPLAFAGYGIEAPEYEYDDYADFDADGKILMILRYEPKSDDEEAEFGGKNASRYSTFRRKARIAKAHGVKALLLVNPPNRDPDRDELYAFDSSAARRTYGLPMIHITRKVADALLKKAGMPELKALQEQLGDERQSLSADLDGITVKINTGLQYGKTRNVIGFLPGDGSTDEVIVIGAHYDHVGTRPGGRGKPPQIFNGADDNASGTAGVLELARAFGQMPQTRRGVLFMAYSAEEMGLLGSKHFVEHPTVNIERVKAMVNLDMIGRLSQDKFQITGSNTAEEFPTLVERAAEQLDIHYEFSERFADHSDQASFRRKSIPGIFAFTGIHKQYHQPDDDWELIDAEGGAQVVHLMYLVANELANMEAGPEYVDPDKKKAEREKDKEEDKPADEQVPAEKPDQPKPSRNRDDRPVRPNVRLGVIFGYPAEGDESGLPVDGVSQSGPAKRAGMKEGDLIIKLGANPIGDIRDYMEALRQFKPGDEVDIVVKRGDDQITFKVKLEASRRRARDNR